MNPTPEELLQEWEDSYDFDEDTTEGQYLAHRAAYLARIAAETGHPDPNAAP